MQKQVVAEILGIKPERITVEVPDTNHAPFHDGIKGQGATHVTGQAASRATHALIESMKARAAFIGKRTRLESTGAMGECGCGTGKRAWT